MAYTPTKAMKEEAQKGLQWRREHGRGGTEVGIARARDISNGKDLPLETIKRMKSFFARHEQNKKAEGWSPGEKGFPSNGRIAWALWGGDPGKTWADNILDKEDLTSSGESMTTADNLGVTSAKYTEVLEKAKERWTSLGLECPDNMVVGWPFRFLSVGKVFCHHTISTSEGEEEVYQRGKDITLQDLTDALKYFHEFKNPINIDREHNMSEPRGVVLDVFLATDDEGSPCLACVPAYGRELASYVESCNGTLYSSPSIEWASETGSFVDKKTGETIGKFRLTGLAVCVEPGQAPRILDRVRLNADKDIISSIGNNTKEEIPNKSCELFSELLDNDIVIGQCNTKDSDLSGSKGEKLMDPEQMMKAMSDMLDDKFAFLVDFMQKLEEKVDKLAGKAEEVADEESSDEASDDIDVPEEEGASEEEEMKDKSKDKEMYAEKERLSADKELIEELTQLRRQKYEQQAYEAIDKLNIRQSLRETAKRAWLLENVQGVKLTEGGKEFLPFTSVFGAGEVLNDKPQGHSFSASRPKTQAEAMSLARKKFPNLKDSAIAGKAIELYPDLF